MKKIFFLISAAFALVACSRSPERYVAVVEESLPKTVSIYVTRGSSNTIAGAGVFVSKNAHVLTCAHLFAPTFGPIIIVTNEGVAMPAELLAIDTRNDLALLKADTKAITPFVKIADPRRLKVGQEVLAIGNPLNLNGTVTHGIISALNRDHSFRYNLVQSDAFINPGNSGGPLLNLNGELVGINVMLLNPVGIPLFTGLGFATSAGQCYEFMVRSVNKYKGLVLQKF